VILERFSSLSTEVEYDIEYGCRILYGTGYIIRILDTVLNTDVEYGCEIQYKINVRTCVPTYLPTCDCPSFRPCIWPRPTYLPTYLPDGGPAIIQSLDFRFVIYLPTIVATATLHAPTLRHSAFVSFSFLDLSVWLCCRRCTSGFFPSCLLVFFLCFHFSSRVQVGILYGYSFPPPPLRALLGSRCE
jgi:hypothetical protein